MPDRTQPTRSWLARCANESMAYVTTTGRRSGRPHRIEIWFAVEDGRLFLLSGGRDRSDWVRNIQADGRVTVEIRGEAHAGVAHVLVAGTADDRRARELLVAKYRGGDDLNEWGRTALPVAIEFATGDE